MKVVVIGLPGSGKTSVCKSLREESDLVHIQVDDLLQERAKGNDEEAGVCAAHLNGMGKAPDDVISKLLAAKLGEDECVLNGWAFDGFPCTQSQAHGMLASDMEPEAVVFLNLDEESASKRAMEAGKSEDEVKKAVEDFKAHVDAVLVCFPGTITVDATEPLADVVRKVRERLFESASDVESQAESKAAVKIQANYRGHAVRKASSKKMEVVEEGDASSGGPAEEEPSPAPDLKTSDHIPWESGKLEDIYDAICDVTESTVNKGLRQSLKDAVRTKEVNLGANYLGYNGVLRVTDILGCGVDQGVQCLNLKGVGLKDKGLQQLVESLRGKKQLTQLDVSENHFSRHALRALVRLLEENKSIVELQYDKYNADVDVALEIKQALAMNRGEKPRRRVRPKSAPRRNPAPVPAQAPSSAPTEPSKPKASNPEPEKRPPPLPEAAEEAHTTHPEVRSRSETIQEILRSTFEAADVNGDGVLDPAEFKELLDTAELGIDKQDLLMILSEADENDDGKIEWKEFVPLAMEVISNIEYRKMAQDVSAQRDRAVQQAAKLELLHGMTENEMENALTEVFRASDVDKTGSLSRDKFKECLTSSDIAFTRKEINTILLQTPVDASGNVQYGDFVGYCYDLISWIFENEIHDWLEAGDELEEYFHEVLEEFDKEGKGFIDAPALRSVLSKADLGLTRLQICTMISTAQPNELGLIDWRRFVPALASMIRSFYDLDTMDARAQQHKATEKLTDDELAEAVNGVKKKDFEDSLLAAFKEADKDSNGYLDREEMRVAMSKQTGISLTDGEVNALMAAMDENDDGKVSYEEFFGYMYKTYLHLAKQKHMESAGASGVKNS